MLATTIDTLNIPPLWYPTVQQIQAAAEPSTSSYPDRVSKGFNYILGASSMEVYEQLPVGRDMVAELFKPKSELGRQLLALRRSYVENGGKLLDTEAFDRELRQRRGGVPE